MSHICTHTFPVLPYFRRTSETDEADQPPPFPRDVVELCSSFVIQGYGNNTCIIRSVKLPFPEAVLQPAPVGTRKNATCEKTGETDSGPLRPYKPQLVGIALIKSIQSPCKDFAAAPLWLVPLIYFLRW